MNIPNDEYWKNRAEQLEKELHKQAQKTFSDVSAIFDRTIKEVDKALGRWYARLTLNNELEPSLADAKRFLDNEEIQEFKWTVQDYIEHGTIYGLTGAFAKELENASARVHISRLEAMKMDLKMAIEALYGQYLSIANEHLAAIYAESYYHNVFNLFQGFGVGWTFAEIDTNYLERLLAKPWAPDRYNFSKRIWHNKEKLLDNVHKILTRHLILGSSADKPIRELAKAMNTSKYNAGRLIMTESAYFAGEARNDCYKELGVKQYRIIATLDSKTSEICQEMDGKVFNQSEYEAGVTAPPFHVYCRTTTAPHHPNRDNSKVKRIARGEDGKTYYVRGDMTYKEWREEYAGDSERERANKHVKRDYPESKVNKTVVNSKEYLKKFEKISDNATLNKNLFDSAREILKHRDGTLQEDLYLLHKETGEILYKNTTSNVKQGIQYTEKMRKLINKYPGQLVTIHNHPQGRPPSGDDIHVQYLRDYSFGVVLGHDGRVFTYCTHDDFIDIPFMQYKLSIDKYKKQGYNEVEAQIRAMKELSKAYRFDFEEVGS